MQSGNPRGAVIGGISSLAFFGVAKAFPVKGMNIGTGEGMAAYSKLALASGVTGGIMAEVQGGRFGNGFISAGASAFLSPIPEAATSNPAGQAVVAAVIGGTVSRISGGKFANGAITASFQFAMGRAVASKSSRVRAVDIDGGNGGSVLCAPGEGMPKPPDPAVLSAVLSRAQEVGDASSIFESALDIYETPDGISFGDLESQGAHIWSQTHPMSAPGWKWLGNIHGHPLPGEVKLNAMDMQELDPAKFHVGQKVTPVSGRFSRADVAGYMSENQNGWVAPSGSGKVLYYPYQNNGNRCHYEYPIH